MNEKSEEGGCPVFGDRLKDWRSKNLSEEKANIGQVRKRNDIPTSPEREEPWTKRRGHMSGLKGGTKP